MAQGAKGAQEEPINVEKEGPRVLTYEEQCARIVSTVRKECAKHSHLTWMFELERKGKSTGMTRRKLLDTTDREKIGVDSLIDLTVFKKNETIFASLYGGVFRSLSVLVMAFYLQKYQLPLYFGVGTIGAKCILSEDARRLLFGRHCYKDIETGVTLLGKLLFPTNSVPGLTNIYNHGGPFTKICVLYAAYWAKISGLPVTDIVKVDAVLKGIRKHITPSARNLKSDHSIISSTQKVAIGNDFGRQDRDHVASSANLYSDWAIPEYETRLKVFETLLNIRARELLAEKEASEIINEESNQSALARMSDNKLGDIVRECVAPAPRVDEPVLEKRQRCNTDNVYANKILAKMMKNCIQMIECVLLKSVSLNVSTFMTRWKINCQLEISQTIFDICEYALLEQYVRDVENAEQRTRFVTFRRHDCIAKMCTSRETTCCFGNAIDSRCNCETQDGDCMLTDEDGNPVELSLAYLKKIVNALSFEEITLIVFKTKHNILRLLDRDRREERTEYEELLHLLFRRMFALHYCGCLTHVHSPFVFAGSKCRNCTPNLIKRSFRFCAERHTLPCNRLSITCYGKIQHRACHRCRKLRLSSSMIMYECTACCVKEIICNACYSSRTECQTCETNMRVLNEPCDIVSMSDAANVDRFLHGEMNDVTEIPMLGTSVELAFSLDSLKNKFEGVLEECPSFDAFVENLTNKFVVSKLGLKNYFPSKIAKCSETGLIKTVAFFEEADPIEILNWITFYIDVAFQSLPNTLRNIKVFNSIHDCNLYFLAWKVELPSVTIKSDAVGTIYNSMNELFVNVDMWTKVREFTNNTKIIYSPNKPPKGWPISQKILSDSDIVSSIEKLSTSTDHRVIFTTAEEFYHLVSSSNSTFRLLPHLHKLKLRPATLYQLMCDNIEFVAALTFHLIVSNNMDAISFVNS